MERANDILVVEDDAGIRQTVAECLELEGYEVRQAASGAEALAMAAARLPALVLLDVVMPAMDGQQVLRRLRSDPRTARLPVVVMTAAMQVVAGPVEGAEAVLSTPFELAELLAVTARFAGPAPRTPAGHAPGLTPVP